MGKLSKKQLKLKNKSKVRSLDYVVSTHAIERMKERSITNEMLTDALSAGSFYMAFNDGLEKEHYRKGNMVAVRLNHIITTVYWMRGTPQWWKFDNSVSEIKHKYEYELKGL